MGMTHTIASIGVALFWLAKTESVTKTVTKARDSFWQGLTRGDADAVGIVLLGALILGACLAAFYFRNRA